MKHMVYDYHRSPVNSVRDLQNNISRSIRHETNKLVQDASTGLEYTSTGSSKFKCNNTHIYNTTVLIQVQNK